MLIPTFRFFVVPMAAAIVLLALAVTGQNASQAGVAVAVATPGNTLVHACNISANAPDRLCVIPAS